MQHWKVIVEKGPFGKRKILLKSCHSKCLDLKVFRLIKGFYMFLCVSLKKLNFCKKSVLNLGGLHTKILNTKMLNNEKTETNFTNLFI